MRSCNPFTSAVEYNVPSLQTILIRKSGLLEVISAVVVASSAEPKLGFA